jgi:predicted Zn-dependent protease
VQRLSGQIGLWVLLAALVPGCITAPASPDAKLGIAQGRASRALLRLDPPYHVSVNILDSVAPAAYTWDDGRIVISRGLAEGISEDELAAVIAHELGHLYLAGRGYPAHRPFALRGEGIDDEQRADAVACCILADAGIPPAALSSALVYVRDSARTPDYLKGGLSRRIAILLCQRH